MKFNMKQTLFYGDLCVANGYGNEIWEVVGYTIEKCFLHGKVEEEIIYNLMHIVTAEYIIAYQGDATLVCRSAYAIDYLLQLDQNGSPPTYNKPNWRNGENNMSKVNVEAKRNHVYPNTVNGLLDELTDLLGVVEIIGEEESVMERIETVKQRLDKKRLEKLK